MKIDVKELEKVFDDIKQNKKQGIEELYNKYKGIVYGIAFTISKNRGDSEDIMQIIFAKIYEMEDSKLPTNNCASWLYSITKNETINFIKKNKNNISLEKIYEISDNNNELNKVIDYMEFNRIISKLNEKEKEIISLKLLSDFSFKEIGILLKEPAGTVKWRYYKSIYSLKTVLGNLVMSIISFVVGIKILLSKENKNIIQEESIEQNVTVQENIENSTVSDNHIFQDELYNSSTKEEENIQNSNDNTDIIQDKNNTIQENIIYQEQPNNNYNQCIGYSFLGISIIFLIVTLYFFIKYQLKHLRKLSK